MTRHDSRVVRDAVMAGAVRTLDAVMKVAVIAAALVVIAVCVLFVCAWKGWM